jgi:hypothetical protein
MVKIKALDPAGSVAVASKILERLLPLKRLGMYA